MGERARKSRGVTETGQGGPGRRGAAPGGHGWSRVVAGAPDTRANVPEKHAPGVWRVGRAGRRQGAYPGAPDLGGAAKNQTGAHRGDVPMPENFPTLDEKTGQLVDTPYYALPEVAALLHIGVTTARRYVTEYTWPHLVIGRHIYMTPADIAAAMATLRVSNGQRPALGIPIPEDPPAPPSPGDDAGGIR
jgi:hypothetical protein